MAKILIIEDERGIREEVLEWLRFEGYDALGASNGAEGLEIALQELPELIISDINMPEMNGHRVLVELRSNPATSLIPVIFLTARTTRDDFRFGMEMGAEDYITKPFTNKDLMNAVKIQLAKLSNVNQYTNRQMDELRGTLTFSLPHELRTPLVSILGYGELLLMDADDVTPDKIRDIAETIIRGGKRLHQLIENYLLYAQIEMHASNVANQATYRTALVESPDTVVKSVCERVARKYEKMSHLNLDLHADCSARISQNDLEKVVSELVDNAFKFAFDETPITVSTRIVSDTYQIRVTNRGRGIKIEDTKRIGAYMQFDRAFYEQQGSGLGLVIAKRLIELYNGTLSIESKLNEETTVIVEILTVI